MPDIGLAGCDQGLALKWPISEIIAIHAPSVGEDSLLGSVVRGPVGLSRAPGQEEVSS